MIKIGNIEIKNPIAVAPMAGISNAAFRVAVKEMGAGLVVCEMISDQGIHYRNEKTLSMLHIEESEWPLSVQIFGGTPESLAEAAKFVQDNTKAAIIDINMGCPVNKVVKTEAGARCLLDPNLVYERVARVVDAVDIPVSVKMRTGWDADHILAVENALAAQRAGASMVAMHGRTRKQMYEGQADWDIISQVAKEISIPFYGNGDIKTPEEAKYALDNYGVDGVMIGRASLGDPWMIQRTVHYLETGELLPEKTGAEKIDGALDHLQRLVDLKGDHVATREFRGLVSYYLKGIPRASKIKVACTQANSQAEVKEILLPFKDQVIARQAEQKERRPRVRQAR
ncbi:tRNA-dihydrouridine synthase [Aerococcus urinaehominis]|uniref:tRNA-dihydrouridine synthase n=1 Tax=Aerococcus urinaehominis TaxID=128944 RepID=A0A120IAV0_9LACT|nr:tRNA dihydrouridine synthase DusB [Aerococcus urinaehominis]AMB99160.1 tRNA-dihydrouridine synthase [Aerococcus urinaehominis]SDM05776.1 putative TIM-barrel protein, nifR3 family [Aerococcus urinaehominis]